MSVLTNKNGFALVSSNRNRILFYNTDYEITKRIQLYYMRSDLLYLVPVDLRMLNKHRLIERKSREETEFNKDTCIQFTFNNASVLQVELDVAPFRLRTMHIVKAPPAKDEELNIHSNLILASKYIEKFKEAIDSRKKRLDDQFSYTLKGYEMFKDFCADNFHNPQLFHMFNKDVEDELQYKDSMRVLNQLVTDAIMGMDFVIDNKGFKKLLDSKLKGIQDGCTKEWEHTIFKQAKL